MQNGILRGIPYHSWPSPAHYFTDGLALFRSIAMSWTILASSLVFAILAMIKTATGKIYQMLVLIWHCVQMKMMTAIKLYHLSDCSLLSLNSCHIECNLQTLPLLLLPALIAHDFSMISNKAFGC